MVETRNQTDHPQTIAAVLGPNPVSTQTWASPLALTRRDPYTVGSVPVHDRDRVEPDVWSMITACAESGDAWPLVMIGDVGTGKTCAALCLLDLVPLRRYWTVACLCEQLIEVQQGRAEYGQQTDNLAWWWKRYRDYDCVVVDELGARDRVSDFQYETVKRALDERVDLPAVFISNLGLDRLADVYDDRIASRLAGGTVIRFDGEDRRLI